MFLTYQWTSALLGMCLGFGILYLVRINHLHSRYALPWLIAAMCIWILGLFPSSADVVGRILGISYPPTLVLISALALIIIKLLLIDIDRSRTEVQMQRLIQRLAILEVKLAVAKQQDVDTPK